MTKVCEELYPKGTIPNQRSDGFYMDNYLKLNLDIMAKNIFNDMQFLGLCCSSTYDVRTGKSTFMQQIGTYFTHTVNQKYNLNNTFTIKNIVFDGGSLIKAAFKLPKYSVILLDEGDDIAANYWSKLSQKLRRFFRKCGQLNLFILIILPNFFQLPMAYALSRSIFLIDVKFYGEFERGYFDFYNFESKRKLYIKGKKTHDYKVTKPDFYGRFTKFYTIDEKAYRDKKYRDLNREEEEEVLDKKTEKIVRKKIFVNLSNNLPIKSIKTLSTTFGIDHATGSRWRNKSEYIK